MERTKSPVDETIAVGLRFDEDKDLVAVGGVGCPTVKTETKKLTKMATKRRLVIISRPIGLRCC